MKKFILVFGFILFVFQVAIGQEHYYWAYGEKYPLEILPNKQFLLINNDQKKNELAQGLGVAQNKVAEITSTSIAQTIEKRPTATSLDKINWTIVVGDIPKKRLAQRAEVLYSAPFFQKNGKELGLSNLFYVKLKKQSDFKFLKEMAEKSNVHILGSDKYMPLWFVLSCNKNSKGNALEMANLFYESGQFEESQPDLMEDDLMNCTNDQLFNQQWHLNNTGQSGGNAGNDISICNAWDITMGCNDITVAVVDNGLEFGHPDFNNFSNISFDTENGTSPSIIRGIHGVPVAGVIGASADNGIGVAGVAPETQLMSISNSLASSPNSRQARASGINFAWQNGADIINNSWGSSVVYPIIDDAISNAVTSGRNGLGTIVVFSTGNNQNNSISYPSNNPNVIAVGSIDRQGSRASFSNYGNGLDLVAPGVDIRTTDRQGNNGYTSGSDYTIQPGTSLSAPQVAGAASLILSMNPNLTQNEVRYILESTADKVGSYSYTLNAGEQSGLTWNNQMGYGRLNVERALNAVYPISGSSLVCSSNKTFNINNLPAGSSVNWTTSNNLNISSSTNNSITVQASSSTVFGEGWIQAEINIGCGDAIIEKEVWVGRPADPSPVQGSSDVVPNAWEYYSVPAQEEASSYTWNIPSGWSFHHTSSITSNQVLLVTGSSSGYVAVCANNACTTPSNYRSKYVTVSGNDCGSPVCYFTYSPNPVEETLTVEMEPTNFDVLSNDKYQISLNNQYGKVVYEAESNGICHDIDMKNMPKGMYRIVVSHKDKQQIAKILKQ